MSSPAAGKAKAKAKKSPPSMTQDWGCKLARDARLAISSSQHSCLPVTRPKTLGKYVVKDDVCAPVNVKKKKNLSCVSRTPASYGGGKRMEVIQKLIDPVPGGKTDCSGFVSGILCRAGARFKPYEKSCQITSTYELMTLGTLNDCFETPKFTKQNQLRPGCLVVWRKGEYGHVVVVEKAGRDPLGLKRGCGDQTKFNHWNFQVAESVLSGGPSIYTARRRFSRNGDSDRSAMLLLRKKACEAAQENKPVFANAWEEDLSVKVLCHVGNTRPGCIDAKNDRVFKDEACFSHCTK